MTNEMHSSYNQFYSTVFGLLYMFRPTLVVHHQENGIIHSITQYNPYNRAGESKHVEQTKNCGIKLIIRTVNLVGH